MRLINADKLIDIIREEAALFENPVWYSVFIGFVALVNTAPTVDAIPVEQVARMLCVYADDRRPCDTNNGYVLSIRDKFCHGCEYGSNNTKSSYECWLHAIKEGWLDDAE